MECFKECFEKRFKERIEECLEEHLKKYLKEHPEERPKERPEDCFKKVEAYQRETSRSSERIIYIPSGYGDQWLKVYEDFSRYTIVGYASKEESTRLDKLKEK